MLCPYCGEKSRENFSMEALLEWMEVHVPHHAPAHRKCTDECETVACRVLAAQYARFERQPIIEGLDDVVLVPPKAGT